MRRKNTSNSNTQTFDINSGNTSQTFDDSKINNTLKPTFGFTSPKSTADIKIPSLTNESKKNEMLNRSIDLENKSDV